MASAWLIVSVWLAGLGPQVTLQALPDMRTCARVAQSVATTLKEQALGNMTAAHAELQIDGRIDRGEVQLRTVAGREVARLTCVPAKPG